MDLVIYVPSYIGVMTRTVHMAVFKDEMALEHVASGDQHRYGLDQFSAITHKQAHLPLEGFHPIAYNRHSMFGSSIRWGLVFVQARCVWRGDYSEQVTVSY